MSSRVGPAHWKSLRALECFAALCYSSNRELALSLYEKAAKTCGAALGEGHPLTVMFKTEWEEFPAEEETGEELESDSDEEGANIKAEIEGPSETEELRIEANH